MGLEGIQAVRARIAAIEARTSQFGASRVSGTALAAGKADTGASFDDYLAQVSGVGRSATSSLATSVAPPLEYLPYGNGHVPSDVLAPIGIGSHRLAPRAAASFTTMRDAAARDGVTIGITDSYRSYEGQVDVAERKGLSSQGGWAATPGTSAHGWGLAVDVDVDAGGQAWLEANAATFGWVKAAEREPWHWEFRA